jgi:hypothetical protein
MLTEHVDTRWDTDYNCFDSHIHFKVQTQLMTANPNDTQWVLANEMVMVLDKDVARQECRNLSILT